MAANKRDLSASAPALTVHGEVTANSHQTASVCCLIFIPSVPHFPYRSVFHPYSAWASCCAKAPLPPQRNQLPDAIFAFALPSVNCAKNLCAF
ncbi:Pierisin, partial [Clarias magur]